jgi:hypothetical protein
MTSQINPNNIDGAYPVAGQDNNSQGFRDNFTNTKNNFSYAAAEITALQNSSVLTANLSNSAPVVNNLQTSTLSNGFLTNMYANLVNLGTITSATANFALGSVQTFATNGNTTIAFAGFPAAGSVATMTVQANVTSSAHSVTFNTLGANGWHNATGIAGATVANTNLTLNFATAGIYTFTFTTADSAGNITINQTNEQLTPFNNSAETITTSGNCNLAVNTTVFSITGNVTASLATGVPGQVRTMVLANVSGGGNGIVSVARAAWKSGSAGNIILTANGQGATLQCINVGGTNSNWFVVGNNGATFN